VKNFKSVWIVLLLAAGACPLWADGAPGEKPAPVKIIFDTDMSSDCDDCGALAVLNKLADQGEAEILACVANSRERQRAVAASISAINTYYGRRDIPIGTYQGADAAKVGSSYATELRDKFPHHALPDDQEPTALSVERTALISAPDASVTIVSVGFFANLRELLQSLPDAASPLSGMDLVRAKVKELVVMGGQFPKSNPVHGEYNFSASIPLDTQYVVGNWPTPILFSGYEIGAPIISGKALAGTPMTNPVRRAYELSQHNCLQTGRSSWDLTAVLAAVRDPHLYWDVSPSGACDVSISGTDEWKPQPDRGRSYLIKKVPPQEIGVVLDGLMALPPGHAP
jgi:purine nucleosidase